MKKYVGFICCLTVGIFFGLIAVPFYQIGSSIIGGRNIQTLYAPNTNYKASLLKKHNLADMNFVVRVNGERVFVSSDYLPLPDHLYRETLVWDKTGKIVVLELMGKKVFAYNAEEKRELRKGEIENYKLSPIYPDDNFLAPIKDIEE